MSEDWERLGDYVVSRRVELGYRTQEPFAKAAGISTRTLRELEAGRRVARSTLALVESALGWGAGGATTVLRGGEPNVGGPPEQSVTEADVDEAEAAIIGASNDELVRLFRIVETGRGITRADADQWLVDALDMRDDARRRKEAAKRSAS
ncbi:hypothetical protein Lesp02_84380 [Lentzea sp. NBRC 105346]|uniref:helix-turn-helix domain-containing protein n=1 Tax=Lentzea sp. NBRC 105346 TaxID=3032205 RepID=UPI0024A30233|nr:helix-turn-helix domain-containing protein [Lentzea sp. NBRC 105346]GLZ36251.1 hypothetical protein Lesp02_84380 [Lentzea sp. NBRC 105346]